MCEGLARVSCELLPSAVNFAWSRFLVHLLVRLVHFLRHTIEGVCLPPAFSTQPMQRSPVGFELGCLKN